VAGTAATRRNREATVSDIRHAVREYILDEFLPGEDPSQLIDSTELITTGVLDSLATMKLVAFLEERFGIEIAPHETDVDHLNTLDLISELVTSKSAS
jgi:acyl carrier protein